VNTIPSESFIGGHTDLSFQSEILSETVAKA
jgi:hypothetical protein